MNEVKRHRPWGDSVPTEFVLASDYDALAEHLAQLEQHTQCISVEERLPEQFEYVVAARMYSHGI